MLQNITKRTPIKNASDAAGVFRALLAARPDEDQHREMFYVAALDAVNRIIAVELIGIGTVNTCAPFIREVFRLAVMKDAVAVIMCHNHPSGELRPSEADKAFTRRAKQAGDTLGVRVLDHLILGPEETEGYFSLSESGDC